MRVINIYLSMRIRFLESSHQSFSAEDRTQFFSIKFMEILRVIEFFSAMKNLGIIESEKLCDFSKAPEKLVVSRNKRFIYIIVYINLERYQWNYFLRNYITKLLWWFEKVLQSHAIINQGSFSFRRSEKESNVIINDVHANQNEQINYYCLRLECPKNDKLLYNPRKPYKTSQRGNCKLHRVTWLY